MLVVCHEVPDYSESETGNSAGEMVEAGSVQFKYFERLEKERVPYRKSSAKTNVHSVTSPTLDT